MVAMVDGDGIVGRVVDAGCGGWGLNCDLNCDLNCVLDRERDRGVGEYDPNPTETNEL